MIVGGIDPSLRCTGVAVVNTSVKPGGGWFTNRVRTSAPEEDLGALAALDARMRRVQTVVARTLLVLPRDLDLAVIEKPPLRSIDASHNDRVIVYGLLVMKLRERRVPVVEVGPTTRAKYAAGNGNAGKPEVLVAMRALLGALVVPDHNVADAVALAAMGARYVGEAVDGPLSSKQEEAYAAVAWPEEGMQV